MPRIEHGTVLLALLVVTAGRAADPPPNIVLIYADDLGYGDLGCYGHPTIRTPHLDRLAAEGMRFTQFYSAAEVCTPSRAALLTGRLPIRSGMASNRRRVLFGNSAGGIPDEELLLSEALQARGYQTCCIGKWHLGHLPQYLPTRQGFDRYFGLPYSNDMRPLPLLRQEETLEMSPDQSMLTQRYTDEAVAFIKDTQREANKARPFFLYLPHTMPHVPLFANPQERGRSARGLYGDVVEALDASTGRITATLRELGIAENTLIVFSSDNGPWLIKKQEGGSAGLLREGKGSTWEGGMRVPGLFWWPGRIPAGVVTQELASTMDVYVTCLTLAGAPLPKDRTLDGYDISPVLFGQGKSPREVMFYYRGEELFAVRKGAFKAHFKTQAGYGQPRPEAHDPPLLYNLLIDPSEQYDVAQQHPEAIAAIRTEVEAHRATLKEVPNQLERLIAAPAGGK
jgi:arylsulfatase A-like enzyme